MSRKNHLSAERTLSGGIINQRRTRQRGGTRDDGRKYGGIGEGEEKASKGGGKKNSRYRNRERGMDKGKKKISSEPDTAPRKGEEVGQHLAKIEIPFPEREVTSGTHTLRPLTAKK